MASRQSDSRDLVRRCEAVGWETTQTPRGVRVKTPKGVYVIHLTYSDYKSLNLATIALEKKGLLEAEDEQAKDKMEEAQRRIEEGRQSAAKKAVTLSARAKKMTNSVALAKAAGPYLGEPETVSVTWFTEKHPAPWSRWVWMDRDLARYLLKHHNLPGKPGLAGTNRPQSESTIRRYRDIVLAGQWRLTHQGMAMDTEAKVQDAQHRLAAIDAAGEIIDEKGIEHLPEEVQERLQRFLDPYGRLRVPTQFSVGMDPDNFKAIDEGLLRNAAQLFTMEGESYGGPLRSALRLVVAYRTGDESARNRWRLKTTNQELVDANDSADQEALRDAVRAGVAQASAKRKMDTGHKMSPGSFAALQYVLYNANGNDNQFVKLFLEGYVTGVKAGLKAPDRMMLDDDDPRQSLRATLAWWKNRTGRAAAPLDQLGLGITAWNNLVRGRHVTRMVWKTDTPLPEILICKDSGENGSAVPRALVGEVTLHG